MKHHTLSFFAAKTSQFSTIFWLIIFWVVLIITGWIYAQGLNAGFQFDDAANLQGLADIHDFDSAMTFIFSGNAGPLGRPLALLTFALQSYAWPLNPELMIEWNIYLHLLNGALVTILVFNLGQTVITQQTLVLRVAVLTGALWMLLPILASSSLFIVQRMTTLSATFVLIGLIFYTTVRIKSLTNPERHLIKLSVIVILFTVLAAFSKENGILLPLYMLTIEATFFSASKYGSRHTIWKAWQAIFLFLPLTIIICYLSSRAFYSDTTLLQRGFTVTDRIAAQGCILWTYLLRAFLPMPSSLGPFHDTAWHPESNQIFIGLSLFAGILIICCLAIRYRKQYPLPAFAILWYCTGHLLESTTIPLEFYFEHRNYVPLIGPTYALIAVLSLSQIWKKGLNFFVFAYISIIAMVTYMTTGLWGQPLLAAEIWAIENPKSTRAVVQLIKQLEIRNDLNEALHVLDRFITENPDSLGLKLQALKVACFLNPKDNHAARLNEVINNAPTARFENWAVSQPNDFQSLFLYQGCAAINANTINLIADSMTNNPRYASSPIALHNLFALKGFVALQNDDTTNALKHFDTALTKQMSPDLLNIAMSVATNHHKPKFIEKWSIIIK